MAINDKYRRQREYKKRYKEKYGKTAFYKMNNKKSSANYKRAHKDKVNEQARKQRHRITMEVLIHYGGDPPKCACCGESNIFFLTIDHDDNNGAEERKKIFGKNKGSGGANFYWWLKRNGYPEGYHVSCFNCNCGRARNNGICPHKGVVKPW